MKTVFFGSGPVAAKSLELLSKHCDIEAVITKPRPAHHKGSVPVLETCISLGFEHVFTVSNKAELSALFNEHKFESRLGIVIDFGIIIAQDVIDSFELGIVNSHFSLLPEWRGADPITFSILSGQTRTGISLMLINDKMDEGDLLAQADYDLPAGITTPELTDDLIDLSDQALQTILPLYERDETKPAPQLDVSIADSKTPTYSRKLSKDDSVLDFTKTAAELEREVRAFIEWPRSRAKIGTADVVITKAHVADLNGTPGTLLIDGKQLGIRAAEGTLMIDRLIPAGKKEMDAASFLAGHKLG
ncbi:MAG: fmt, methionyl-tRNA formyltransferase [Candidatus Saccharibacteria bacterium]|nr:fmt, methionyl-tRNA formyltransferase [Candidatus Saccharibacteria bacterium]